MFINPDLSTFDNTPIEFKEINPDDFKFDFIPSGSRIPRSDFIIENGAEKILIKPDKDGYINSIIQDTIEIGDKNTVVINAPVGQGKSYAIVQTVKRYVDADERYLIFIASPFVSLVKQYNNELILAGIDANTIYSYDKLGRDSTIDYTKKAVHVITVNTLLGNPGEDGFKNSDVKREYLNTLAEHCEKEKIKVVFIYDEIHDSYYNFKQEYIFNLWKWKKVIHKNFILSATYNEASKVVIEYLAELTDFKIKIIESERKRFVDKQSDLFLHYSSAYNFTSKTKEIVTVIKDLISQEKNIDILTYSKTLAKSLLDKNDELGKLLAKKFGDIKNCTSELISNQRGENREPENQYDNNKCNIGTNFKTGVSIKKDNHAFIIILPPRSTRLTFRNKYGIFSGGINSVIQALARQRKKGEIHIILPKPDHFDYSSLAYSSFELEEKKVFEQMYTLVRYHKIPESLVKYVKLNRQDFYMRTFYENKLKGNVLNEITTVLASSRRDSLPKLLFPTYHEFKLESGEDYIANEFPIFGGDISAYTTYAALANQFINCRLKGFSFRPVIQFEDGKVNTILTFIFNNFYGEDYLYSLGQHSNFSLFYNEFKLSLYREFHVKYKKEGGDDFENIDIGSPIAKKFELKLLLYIYKLKNSIRISNEDEDFTRGDYFSACIAHSEGIDITTLDDGEFKNRVKFYQLCKYFRDKMIGSLQHHARGSEEYYFIPTQYYEGFLTDGEKTMVKELIKLSSSDSLLENNVFEFKRRFTDRSPIAILKTLYSLLKEDFLQVENRTNDPKLNVLGRRRNVKPVQSIKLIPSKTKSINLIENQDYISVENVQELSSFGIE